MYICICNQITDERLNNLLDQGMTFNEAMKKLGVGSDCGICILESLKVAQTRAARNKTNKPRRPQKISK